MNRLRIREVVRKEFIQLFRDKKNRPMLIIAPLIQLLLFGYVVTTDVRDIRVGVYDQSRTRESRMLMDALNANRIFRRQLSIVHQVRTHFRVRSGIDINRKRGKRFVGNCNERCLFDMIEFIATLARAFAFAGETHIRERHHRGF